MKSKASVAAAAAVPVETELKLAITPEGAARLARHPLLRALRRGPSRKSQLASTYFDTDNQDLIGAGVVLRLRRDGRKWLQAVKGRADKASAGGLTSRAEFEWPVTGFKLDPLRFATTPFRRVLGKAEKRGLVSQFTTQIQRTTIPLTFPDSTMALLCIDSGEVHGDVDGKRLRTPILEIELELEAGNPARLYELAGALAADIPLSLQLQSKAERGYALRRPRIPRPLSADDAALSRDASAAEAFAAIIRACLAQIEGNANGALAEDDPEWIHQLRIGVRRLRACLALASRTMAPARVEPLRVELRWLAQVLGQARDWDVFTLETLPAFTAAVARSSNAAALKPALRALAVQSETRRAEARTAAHVALESGRFLRLVLAAAALAQSPAAGSPNPTGLAALARDVARPLLKRRHRALLALGSDLAHAAPETRHAARLAAKKLRYATEFFAPLFEKKRARSYRRALAVLQEELGAWNDAAVAVQLAGELAGAASPAAAAFSGWAAAQGSSRSSALCAAWDGFSHARAFWPRT
ncbi:MAG: CYTH and CHAD domain-containing protein [Betaproteobacteria bacterium]